MQQALQRLDYNSYHAMKAALNRKWPYWPEALKAKYAGEGKLYQRAQFDKILGIYSVSATHCPHCNVPDVERSADNLIRPSPISPASCL